MGRRIAPEPQAPALQEDRRTRANPPGRTRPRHIDDMHPTSEALLQSAASPGPRPRSRSIGWRVPLALAGALLVLAACGKDGASGDRGGAFVNPTFPDGPLQGQVYGQEIWLTYFDPPHARYGRRVNRTKEAALALARDLRERVKRGEDIGTLARSFSNAQGGVADGWTGVLPLDPGHPTIRERALASVRPGEVTPIVDWLGGFWFGKRADETTGKRLEAEFHRLARLRVSFRAIVMVYRGSWMPDTALREQVTRSKEDALRLARALIVRLQSGERFEDLAKQYSNDGASAANGGLVTVQPPGGGGPPTPWIPMNHPSIPESVMKVVLEDDPGTLHPEPIVSERGVFVIRTEGRKEVDEPAPAASAPQ